MPATRSKIGAGQLVHASGSSITQRLARAAAVHPWRVVVAWGLVLVASIVAIGALLGSAFTSDGSITSNPDSMRAEQVIADNFSQADRIDDAVVIYSADLTSDDPRVPGLRRRRPVLDRSHRRRADGPATPTPPTGPASPRTATRPS